MKLKNKQIIRKFGKILVVCYLGFLLYFLLLSEMYGRVGIKEEYAYNLELFKEIKRFWEYREVIGSKATVMNLIGNVVVFIPFGVFLPMASKYKSFIITIFYSFLLSLSVEVIQLIAKVGSFDVDDLLLNTIGGCIGYLVFLICRKIRRRHVSKKTEKRL